MNTQSISATDARNQFSDMLSRVVYRRQQFFIHRKGKPVAVLMPMSTLENLKQTSQAKNNLSQDPLTEWRQKYSSKLKDLNATQVIRRNRDTRWTSS